MKYIIVFITTSLVFSSFAKTTKVDSISNSKAKSSCRQCDILRSQGEDIGLKIKSGTIDMNEAIEQTTENIAVFLTGADKLSDFDLESIIMAWLRVSIADSARYSIPLAKGISNKISTTDFNRIQKMASKEGSKLCPAPKTSKEKSSCSSAEKHLRDSYFAISLSIMQAKSENQQHTSDE